MRAITVCVEYSDYLEVTLPYNRHHFDEVWVVTTADDERTATVAEAAGARVFVSDAFYRNGADFNKWAALEEGLDAMGRAGWLCLLDADVLWPRSARFTVGGQGSMDVYGLGMTVGCSMRLCPGHLYTPRRRMFDRFAGVVPPEAEWADFPLHPNAREWAGYSQIFHASDPALGPSPWHDVTWRHAGGADSFFQARWPVARKVRPPFEVLHLGPPARNWCGRASPWLLPGGAGIGTTRANGRARRLREYLAGRVGKPAASRHAHEKLQ